LVVKSDPESLLWTSIIVLTAYRRRPRLGLEDKDKNVLEIGKSEKFTRNSR